MSKPNRIGSSRLRILAILQDRLETRRPPPSVRELASAIGMYLNGVNAHLHALERQGFLESEKSGNGLTRSYRALTLRCRLEVTEEGRRRAGLLPPPPGR